MNSPYGIMPGNQMEYNPNKVDEVVRALLWLTQAGNGWPWKSHDWNALERLHAKGYIYDPRSETNSVVFSEYGEHHAQELFQRMLDGRLE